MHNKCVHVCCYTLLSKYQQRKQRRDKMTKAKKLYQVEFTAAELFQVEKLLKKRSVELRNIGISGLNERSMTAIQRAANKVEQVREVAFSETWSVKAGDLV